MNFDRLDDKVAVITGAASGIGRATALSFAREGAALGLCDVDAERLAGTADAAWRAGARAVHTELTD
ncbi:MAG TPA: SDR family NAD(P)-dependent oxidoreductase, partial [Polyangiaceae bacterium]|nr:SDR family NAD(P)-dependent oxidoreductase [Polyangiaceae bacterium]